MEKSGKDPAGGRRQPQQSNGRGRRPENREARLQSTKAQHRAETEAKAMESALSKANRALAGEAKTPDAPETKDVKPGEKLREEGGHAVYRHKDTAAAPGPEASAKAAGPAPGAPAADPAPEGEFRLEPPAAKPRKKAPAEKPAATPQKKAPEESAPAPEVPKPAPMALKDASETPAAPSAILAIFDEMQNRLEGDPERAKRLRQMNLPAEMGEVIAREQAALLRELRERLAGVDFAPAASASPAFAASAPVPVKEIPCWNKEMKAEQDAAAACWLEAQEAMAQAHDAAVARDAAMVKRGLEPMLKSDAAASTEDDSEDEDDWDDFEDDSSTDADAAEAWREAAQEWQAASSEWKRVSETIWEDQETFSKQLSWTFKWVFVMIFITV